MSTPAEREHVEQDQKEQKVYPGNLSRYSELRKAREEAERQGMSVAGEYVLAEELAGLAYILDGIRYAARQNA